MTQAIEEMGAVRAFQTLAKMNQKEGFDCPGCAWPDPDDKRSVLGEYCENGAKALAEEATLKRVDPAFFQQHSIQEISSWSDYRIGKSGRLTHPMILKSGRRHYEAISWSDAFAVIAEHLQRLDSPNEAVFYTSGRSSNEAAFLYALMARAYGTNNLPDCSNMCHESSGVALGEMLGIGKGSVTLDDLHKADVVMIMGQNPGTNHPRMLSSLQKLKENGGKIISINPLAEAGLKKFKNPQRPKDYFSGGTRLTDVHLAVKINQDIPLLKAMMIKLNEKDQRGDKIWDWNFIRSQTLDHETFMAQLMREDLDELVKRSGVSASSIDEAVEQLASAKKIIICWAMGLTQHRNGVENIKECVNLLLLKGSIGKEGAGTCPVRGHSNVQGDRSVGIVSKPKLESSQRIREVFGFDPAMDAGMDTVGAIQAMHEGKAKIFMALGGNFACAASDSFYTAEALQRCDLTVSIATKLNRSHLIAGKTSLILPTLGRSEEDKFQGQQRYVTVENSMGKVHKSQGKLAPASEHLMSEPEIIANIAHEVLGAQHPVRWLKLGRDYQLIREKISATVAGFEGYKTLDREGFYLPNHARAGDFSRLPEGKIRFSLNALPDYDLSEDEFLLMTIRSHDQFNTTIYGLDDRYRGIYNERRVLLMNEQDMKDQALEKLELVDISSHYGGQLRHVELFHVIPYQIPRGNLAAYFPETNPLVPIDQYAEKSRTPISKSIIVKLKKSRTQSGVFEFAKM